MNSTDGAILAGSAPVPLVWQAMPDAQLWDRTLAAMGGHPLQSALWGEARKRAEGIDYLGVVCQRAGEVVAMARIERRQASVLGTVAWIPQGPVVAKDGVPLAGLQQYLADAGFIMTVCKPWAPLAAGDSKDESAPKTIWIDLTPGKDRLLQNLDAQWRYGARRALREGVVIGQTNELQDISAFYRLCVEISHHKGFSLPASLALMQQLLTRSAAGEAVEARLFAARAEGRLAGGVLVLRAGRHLHYMWGGVDRGFARLRAGEALQWAVIEWGLEQGCTLYDLEGIDPVGNPGTYQFKMKMGGKVVTLAGMQIHPLGWRGRLLAPFIRRRF